MKRILLTVAGLSLMLGASAASKRLVSITEKSYGSTYVTSIAYDEAGRLLKVTDDYSTYTFDYSQLTSNKLILTREEKWEDPTTYEMTLNDEGYVVKVLEYDGNELDEDYYTFEYAGGRLVNYKQIRPDEVEESKISYDADGVVIKIENLDASPSECETVTFEYNGIANVGNLALWDGLFDVDLDDIEYAAMAGFMGKAPAQLPVKSTTTDVYGSESNTFDWTVGEDGYPTALTMKDEYDTENYEFAWEIDESGVGAVVVDVDGNSRYYTTDGVLVSGDAKGIVIERKADGTVVKRINR